MGRKGFLMRFVAVVVVINFIFVNSVIAEGVNYLAVDAKEVLGSVFKNFSVLKTPLALHNAITSQGISGLKELVGELDHIKEVLVKNGILKKDEAEKYYAMTFTDNSGSKAYYYFNKDGYFFRITGKDILVNDDFSTAFLREEEGSAKDINGYKVEGYKVSKDNMDAIDICINELYGYETKPIRERYEGHAKTIGVPDDKFVYLGVNNPTGEAFKSASEGEGKKCEEKKLRAIKEGPLLRGEKWKEQRHIYYDEQDIEVVVDRIRSYYKLFNAIGTILKDSGWQKEDINKVIGIGGDLESRMSARKEAYKILRGYVAGFNDLVEIWDLKSFMLAFEIYFEKVIPMIQGSGLGSVNSGWYNR